LKYKELPCIVIPSDTTTEQLRRYLLKHNSSFGKWDFDLLANDWDFAELSDAGIDIPDIDFNDGEDEQGGNTKTQAVEDDFDHPPVNEIETEIKQGDLITFHKNGKELHRLLCGDSTKREDVERVMNGEKADLIFTDPPYGVSYTGVSKQNTVKWEQIKNDNLRGDGLFLFLVECFTLLFENSKPSAAAYIWYAASNHIQFETALTTAGFKVRQQLIWNKGMVLGRSDYHWAHEPCLYCRKENERTSWYGDRTAKTILGLRRTDILSMKKEELIVIVKNLMNENTCWEIDRDLTNQTKTYQHPTQKPVTLAGRAINNNSQIGELVTDFFLGSGSTMVAAHQLNRKCYGLELDPKYCQVILSRMEALDDDIEVKINGVIVDKNLPF
jgi:DNA modification methylase